MVIITMNNNATYELSGDLKVIMKLQKAFTYRHPNAIFLIKGGYVQKGWDGNIRYITEKGLRFKSGLLPIVYDKIIELGSKVKIIDNRIQHMVKPIIPETIGKLTPRDYQLDFLKALVNNKVGNTPYYQGVFDAATNAGKTLMMAGVYYAFKKKIPTLVLIKDGGLFKQFMRELPEIIDKDELGFIQGKKYVKWGNFTVAMVQTLSPKVKDREIQRELSKKGIVLVDEADEANSKQYKSILMQCYNAYVKVGLSGSIYMSNLKKHLIKNMDLKCFFSVPLHKVTKKDMHEMGYSANVVSRFTEGNTKLGIKGDYSAEYDKCISSNKDRAKKVLKRILFHLKRGRNKQLIVFRFHKHGKLLYNIINKELGNKYKVHLTEKGSKDNHILMEKLAKGEIDILISSLIVKRGKNIPSIRVIVNATGTDSQETVSQIQGRGERIMEGKDKYYYEDFIDQGYYLMRHSKHRIRYCKAEGFKVIIQG